MVSNRLAGAHVLVDPVFELHRRQRFAEQVPLDLITIVLAQKLELFLGFDAFRHHAETQVVS